MVCRRRTPRATPPSVYACRAGRASQPPPPRAGASRGCGCFLGVTGVYKVNCRPCQRARVAHPASRAAGTPHREHRGHRVADPSVESSLSGTSRRRSWGGHRGLPPNATGEKTQRRQCTFCMRNARAPHRHELHCGCWFDVTDPTRGARVGGACAAAAAGPPCCGYADPRSGADARVGARPAGLCMDRRVHLAAAVVAGGVWTAPPRALLDSNLDVSAPQARLSPTGPRAVGLCLVPASFWTGDSPAVGPALCMDRVTAHDLI